MNFENKAPKWDAAGAEPSADLQKNGFLAGYKPPAAYFNFLFNAYTKCINELQTILGQRHLKTYTSLDQLGITEGSETIESIVAAMPNLSLLQCATSSSNNMAIYPSEYGGTLIVEKSFGNRAKFTYFAQSKEWAGHYFNGVWYGWKLTFDEANPPTAAQVGALALDGTAVNASKVNYTMLTGETSILERALNLGVGTYEFSLNGASYTGGDLPHSNYSYGRATIQKRADNAIAVILWGFNVSSAFAPVINQYGSNGWSGWKKFFTEANPPTANEVGALPNTGGTVSGNTTFNANATFKSGVYFYGDSGEIEGGQVVFAKPPNNSAFAGDITMDIWDNQIRWFAQHGGEVKIFKLDYADFTSGGNANIYHSKNIIGRDTDVIAGSPLTTDFIYQVYE